MKTKTILNTSGALVTLGGAAVGSYYALNSKSSTNPSLNNSKEQVNPKLKQKEKKTISAWLQSNGNKVILSKHDVGKQEVWNNKWTKFQEWYETNKGNKDWEIFDWERKKNNGDAYNHLQELCETNSKKETDDEGAKLITEVVKHCVEDTK